MEILALQLFLDGRWVDAATLDFPHPELGVRGPCDFEYDFDYFKTRLGTAKPNQAISVHLPVDFGPTSTKRWPFFLDDIRPMGSARNVWCDRFNIPSIAESDFRLLREATIAPIGNMRIKEAVPNKLATPARFPRQTVIDREHGFLEYAVAHGAQVGGATGAGGDAPKLLLRADEEDQIWIDTWQDEPANTDRHYLVKFARGDRTERDKNILRSEYIYYRVLAELGFEVARPEEMRLEESETGVSLWLPRFDVEHRSAGEFRFGVESIYSIVKAEPGAWLKHEEILKALRPLMVDRPWRETLLEYLQRDLLNLVFGNSDNHGRNTALLKTDTTIHLAPIYDFAPMKMDPEGVTRTTRWTEFESGPQIDWAALLKSFGVEEDYLRSGLRALAEQLQHLPQMLAEFGLPDETMNFPAMGLNRTEQKLREWGLL